MTKLAALSFLALMQLTAAPESEPSGSSATSTEARAVRCPATRDVWLSAVDEERDFNMGAAPRIKLKVWQEFGLVDFDVSPLLGRSIERAYLYLKPDGGHKLGLNGGSDLRWLSVSTVSHDWVEGRSAGYARDPRGHGATFHESSFGRRGWGWEGARVWDVILGNGNTLRHDGQLEPAPGGWLRIELEPRLVQALMAGASHGLLLMDGSTGVEVNCMIRSRESGEGPYLEVVAGEPDREAPPKPAALAVEPAPERATPDLGAARIRLRVPPDAFAYEVRVNGAPIDRWQIPFAGPAETVQTFPLLDLPADQKLEIEVAAVDEGGNRSEFATAAGRASPPLTAPRLPPSPFTPAGGEPPALGGATVWALPEVTKLDPVSGELLGERAGPDFRRRNPVWDGANDRVRLAAARGEIVSFQVAVEGEARDCRLEITSLSGPGTIDRGGVRMWRNWYVGRHPEYALPLFGSFDVPSSDNGIAGQTLQAVTIDYHVPITTPPGTYNGTLTVTCGHDRAELGLVVDLYDVTIPETVHFNAELNCYRGPGRAGSDQFIDSFRLAHYHRATINRVPYSQRGAVHGDWAPTVDGRGRIVDWSRFDAHLGGLLDGSWFRDNPRSGVPVPVLYLPFFEGWPLDYRGHYDPGTEVPSDARDRDAKLRHDLMARPIAQALDPGFQEAFSTAVAEFVRHFDEKGWTRTAVQLYLNNKPRYGYSLWTLDEPFEYLDWAALNFFGNLFKRAVDDPETYDPAWHRTLFRQGLAAMNRGRPTFMVRADISRPQWQGSVSDRVMNSMYAGGAGFTVPRLLRSAKLRMPATLYTYGSANEVGQSNWGTVIWCLRAYAHHFDGVLPWQSLGGPRALRKPSTTALLINAGDYGHAVASLRLHALRRGVQDAELLRLLEVERGWSRERIGLLLAQRLPQASPLSPWPVGYGASEVSEEISSYDFLELKEGVLQLLAPRP